VPGRGDQYIRFALFFKNTKTAVGHVTSPGVGVGARKPFYFPTSGRDKSTTGKDIKKSRKSTIFLE